VSAGIAVTVMFAAPPPAAFDVGILRRDGILIPFASFDGKSWSAPWPAAQSEATVPINIQSVPSKWWGAAGPLDAWSVWLGPGTQRTVHVTQPDVVDVHCSRHVGLRTDYRSDQLVPPPVEQPYPKDGLALSPPQAVEPIEMVPTAGNDATKIANTMLAKFNEAEDHTVSGVGHPNGDRAHGVVPSIEALYAHGTEPRVFYVEAAREYDALGSHECGAVAFGTSWLVREAGSFRVLALAVDEVSCDRSGASFMLPFGVLRIGGRVFWVVQFSGWDHERYAIVEPKAKSVDAPVSVWGGACS
jgi:hypothetical protein